MCAQVGFGIRAVGAQQGSADTAQRQRPQHLTDGKFFDVNERQTHSYPLILIPYVFERDVGWQQDFGIHGADLTETESLRRQLEWELSQDGRAYESHAW